VLVPIRGPGDLEPFAGEELLSDLDPALLEQHGSDAHWLLLEDGVAACCSLWWRDAPRQPEATLGLIGHFAARDARAAHTLLEHACHELAARGCTRAVGPMDGSTWRRYRFVVERGEAAPFLLEPDNPDRYPEHWRAAGFRPLAHYSSALQDDLSLEPPHLERILGRLEAAGIRIRPLLMERVEEELRGIYRVTLRSFESAFLYTPISEDDYLQMYRPLLPLVRPELCLIAEADRPLGYLFALPDALQAQRGQAVDTAIVKTVAVLPEVATRGLGSALVALLVREARRLGYRRAVHALMHEGNASQRISRDYRARQIRRYALFAREL
jgi:GNAT superfamily N-acetyltransferase